MPDRPVALLVGASSGLGAALAQILAPHYHLVLLASSQPRLETLDDALQQQGHRATLVPVDLGDDHEHIEGIVAGIWQRFSRLDLLVGLAATTVESSPLAHLDPRQFQRMMMVNCQAHFRFLRASDALLRQVDRGRVLMIGGHMAYDPEGKPNPFTAGFDATKAALAQMTQSFSAELGQTTMKAALVLPYPFKSRLRTVIYPGQPGQQLSTPAQQAEQLADRIVADDWNNGDQLTLAM